MQCDHALSITDQLGNIGNWDAFLKENSCEGMPESMRRGLLFERTRQIEDLTQPCIAPDITQLLHIQRNAATEDQGSVNLLASP